MPKVIRTMLKQDGLPTVGTGPNMLGARVPQAGIESIVDIFPDSKGRVFPDTGGISVARSLRDLLPHLIPKRLRPHSPDAIGNNNRFVWKMGDGEFSDGVVANRLYLRQKPKNRDGKIQGLIEPNSAMSLEDYQLSLADTRQAWSIDEPI